MTEDEFQQKIMKSNLYDKYWYYLLYTAGVCLGIFLLYHISAYPIKYNRYGIRLLAYLSSAFFIVLGILGLYLVPNRYKILSVNSSLTNEKKNNSMKDLINNLEIPYYDIENNYYKFKYKKNWWASEYNVFLGIDVDCFYLSVQSNTGGYIGGGIIDFGGTEKVRQKIITELIRILE